MRQQKRRQVVDREPELVPVAALLPGARAPDPGVVDQEVQPLGAGQDRFGQPPHLGQRGEVGEIDAEAVVPGGLLDLAERRLPARRIAAVEQHRRPPGGQLPCDGLAEPIGRAGDENDLVGNGSH